MVREADKHYNSRTLKKCHEKTPRDGSIKLINQ